MFMFILALSNGNEGVVGVLLRAGANPMAETTVEHLEIPAGSTPLSVAEHQGHAEIARLLETAQN